MRAVYPPGAGLNGEGRNGCCRSWGAAGRPMAGGSPARKVPAETAAVPPGTWCPGLWPALAEQPQSSTGLARAAGGTAGRGREAVTARAGRGSPGSRMSISQVRADSRVIRVRASDQAPAGVPHPGAALPLRHGDFVALPQIAGLWPGVQERADEGGEPVAGDVAGVLVTQPRDGGLAVRVYVRQQPVTFRAEQEQHEVLLVAGHPVEPAARQCGQGLVAGHDRPHLISDGGREADPAGRSGRAGPG